MFRATSSAAPIPPGWGAVPGGLGGRGRSFLLGFAAFSDCRWMGLVQCQGLRWQHGDHGNSRMHGGAGLVPGRFRLVPGCCRDKDRRGPNNGPLGAEPEAAISASFEFITWAPAGWPKWSPTSASKTNDSLGPSGYLRGGPGSLGCLSIGVDRMPRNGLKNGLPG